MGLHRFVAAKTRVCRVFADRRHLVALAAWCAVAAAWCAPGAAVLANEQNGNETAPSAEADFARLIDQLGADSFAERERASKQLLSQGLAVYADLQNVDHHPDRETRLRVRRLLLELVEIDRQTQLSEFIIFAERDFDELPGWTRLREIVGDTRPARLLMAGVLRENWDVLAESEQDANSAAAILMRRCEELQHARSVERRQLEREDVASLLLLAVNPDVGVYKQTQQQIYNLCYQIRFGPDRASGVTITDDDPLRKLLGAWVARPSDVADTAFYSLNIALRFSLPEGLVPAVQILDENNAAPYIRQYAILTVARFKDRQSVPRLKALLNDESVCYSQTDPRTKNIAFQCQVRDVALAILLYLEGHDPKDFGFQKRRPSANMVYQPNTLGFENDEVRAAAFAAWEELEAEPAEVNTMESLGDT